MIDTENGSGDLYAHLGEYLVLPLEAPYTPDRYVKAIKAFEESGVEVIIIDSLTHAWSGVGGALEIVDTMMAGQKNKFTAWREVTPKHNALVEAMLQSKCHIIATMRAKTEYVLEEENGKKVPKKIGLAPIQRDGMEYEFTVMFDISHQHIASASKDRTGLFDGQYFKADTDTGKILLEWLETGAEVVKSDTLEAIKAKWSQLGFKESALDAQLMKSYGTNRRNLTEVNAQDFITKLDGLLQTKLMEAESEQAATSEEGETDIA